MRCHVIIILLLLAACHINGQQTWHNTIYTGWGITAGDEKDLICLRKISNDGNNYWFTVLPRSLKTRLIPSRDIFVIPASWDLIRFLFRGSPYIKALRQADEFSSYIQDAGFTRFRSPGSGIDLTIDLCPSKLPLDRIVFSDMVKEFGKVERPVPLAICITGKWIETHQYDLAWIDSLINTGDISVLWVNHSYNHFTYKQIPLIRNFMLAKGTDIDAEVLKNETALIGRNIVPSVFFRFPGLISDRIVYDRILTLGLIPLGSDAWLAKGQIPGNGSIVLIHANGNEPVGVHDFIKLLKSKEKDVLRGRWELFDLRESLVVDESGN